MDYAYYFHQLERLVPLLSRAEKVDTLILLEHLRTTIIRRQH